MFRIEGKHGLLWIGEVFYKTPQDFTLEARDLGVSRRIKAVPLGFELGKHWVLVAHRKAYPKSVDGAIKMVPGIFHAFKPSAIEYVVRGDESDDEIEALEERGITPVRVVLDLPLAPATKEDEEDDD